MLSALVTLPSPWPELLMARETSCITLGEEGEPLVPNDRIVIATSRKPDPAAWKRAYDLAYAAKRLDDVPLLGVLGDHYRSGDNAALARYITHVTPQGVLVGSAKIGTIAESHGLRDPFAGVVPMGSMRLTDFVPLRSPVPLPSGFHPATVTMLSGAVPEALRELLRVLEGPLS